MSALENRQIATKWFDAFNQHNLEALLHLYHADAIHYSPKLKIRRPETGGYIRGKKALHDWWEDAFTRLPSLTYRVNKLVASDEAVFMEYIRCVDDEEDMLIGELLEICDGVIQASRVYHG